MRRSRRSCAASDLPTRIKGSPSRGNGAAYNRAVAPRFIGVAANVDALEKTRCSGCRILDMHGDVENEVADLLDSSPRGSICTDLLREIPLTPVAVSNCRAVGDLLLHVGWNGDDLEAARGVQLLPEQIVEHPKAPIFERVGWLQRRIDQVKAQKDDAWNVVSLRTCNPRTHSPCQNRMQNDPSSS